MRSSMKFLLPTDTATGSLCLNMWFLNSDVKRLLCGLLWQEQEGSSGKWPKMRWDSMKAEAREGRGGHWCHRLDSANLDEYCDAVNAITSTFALKCMFKQAVDQFSSIHSTIFAVNLMLWTPVLLVSLLRMPAISAASLCHQLTF